MKKNRLRELIDNGGLTVGAFLDIPSVRVVEYCGILGFDWVLIDAEHEGVSVETAYSLVMAAENQNMGTLLRVPANNPEVILPYAETGVDAILAPHIRTAEDAEKLVSALRYHPHGTRGAGVGRPANYGLTATPKDYFEGGNSVLCAALLEDREAYEGIDDIMAVPGIDFYCFGTMDLAGSVGYPGQKHHPEVKKLVDRAVAALASDDRLYQFSVGSADEAKAAVSAGSGMLVTSVGALLAKSAKELLPELRTLDSAEPAA